MRFTRASFKLATRAKSTQYTVDHRGVIRTTIYGAYVNFTVKPVTVLFVVRILGIFETIKLAGQFGRKDYSFD